MKKITYLILIMCLCISAGCNAAQRTQNSSEIEATNESQVTIATETADPYQVVPVTDDEPVAAVEDVLKGWGYINLSGQWVIAPQYQMAYPFVDGVATVKVQNVGWKLINKQNETIATFPSNYSVVEQDQPPDYGSDVRNKKPTITEGMIVIVNDEGRGYRQSGDLYGFADITGKIVVEPKYIGVKSFHDGLAAVNLGTGPYDVGPWSYIDKTGSIVLDLNYPQVGNFSDGLAQVEFPTPGHSGLIDKTGTEVVAVTNYGLRTLENNLFTDGVAPARVNGNGFGIVDTQGNIITAIQDESGGHFLAFYSSIVGTTFSEGMFAFNDPNQPEGDNGYFPQGFMDTKGNIVIQPQYDWIVAGQFSQGLCAVEHDKKVGYIDKTGTLVIPYLYDIAFPFTYDLAAVSEPGKPIVYIDKTGAVVIEFNNLPICDAFPFTK